MATSDSLNIRSMKQAAACRLLGCEARLIPDPNYIDGIIAKVSPANLAEEAIAIFEGGERLPARALLDVYADIHREIKTLLKERRSQRRAQRHANTTE